MINTILTTLFNSWNTQSKCGKCWKFVKTFNDNVNGLTNLYLPTKEDKCCTHIFLEDETMAAVFEDTITGFKRVACDYTVRLKIVEQSDFQKPKGDETGCDNSIYSEIIEPLKNCLGCSFEDDLCVLDGYQSSIRALSITNVFSKADYNWAGLDYRLTLRVYD